MMNKLKKVTTHLLYEKKAEKHFLKWPGRDW